MTNYARSISIRRNEAEAIRERLIILEAGQEQQRRDTSEIKALCETIHETTHAMAVNYSSTRTKVGFLTKAFWALVTGFMLIVGWTIKNAVG